MKGKIRKNKSGKSRKAQVKNPAYAVDEFQCKKGMKKNDIPMEDELVTRSVTKLEDFIDEVNIPKNENLTETYDHINENLEELVEIFNNKQIPLNDENLNIITSTEQNRTSIERLLIIAKKYLEKEEYYNALNCINRVLELDPNHMDAWMVKGDVLLEIGKRDGLSICPKTDVASQHNQIISEDYDDPCMNELLIKEWYNALLILIMETYGESWLNDCLKMKCPECGFKMNFDVKSLPIFLNKGA